MKKIIDAFIFYNELDILMIRLKELYDIVDHFILVEGTLTFTGNKKKLYYEENKNQFLQYHDKIIHIIVEDYPETTDPWEREYHQRCSISCGIDLLSLHPEDIIILSDVDEVLNSNTVSILKLRNIISPYKIYCLSMTLYYYTFEWTTNRKWDQIRVLSYDYYKNRKKTMQEIRLYPFCRTIPYHGGWHLSYFGGISRIYTKLEGFSEQQDNTIENKDNMQECIDNGILYFNKEKLIYVPLAMNLNLPNTIMEYSSHTELPTSFDMFSIIPEYQEPTSDASDIPPCIYQDLLSIGASCPSQDLQDH
jgi:beta-1,4-mannosyl-glycoprotein beta-1,4-N-acetylglucosaminyltransferase